MSKIKKLYADNREMYRLLCIMLIWLIFMAFTQSKKFYTGANFLTMSSQFPEYGLMVLGGMLCMMTGGAAVSKFPKQFCDALSVNLGGVLPVLLLALVLEYMSLRPKKAKA